MNAPTYKSIPGLIHAPETPVTTHTKLTKLLIAVAEIQLGTRTITDLRRWRTFSAFVAACANEIDHATAAVVPLACDRVDAGLTLVDEPTPYPAAAIAPATPLLS